MENTITQEGVFGCSVYLDFALTCDRETKPVIMSYYHRSLQQVKSFGANININSRQDLVVSGETCIRCSCSKENDEYTTIIQPVTAGKEKFYHALSIRKSMNKSFLLLESGKEGETFYNYLMENFELPLMREWGKELFNWFVDNTLITKNSLCIKSSYGITNTIPIKGREVLLSDLYVLNVSSVTDGTLRDAVTQLLQSKRIQISSKPQNKLQFKDMDSYFKEYGPTLVSNLNELLKPLTTLDGEAHDFATKSKRLYPQQIAQVNGDVALLENGKFAILNHGMGTGKTLTTGAIAESYFVRKWLRKNPKRTYADAYSKEGLVTYRNIVMCPGHLVEKWAEEIKSEIPYAHVEILRDFKQLTDLRERGSVRTKKEWYVLSKDFCKLSYMMEPTPKKVRSGMLKKKKCAKCGSTYSNPGHTCPDCGSKEYVLIPSSEYGKGMVCPCCNQILLNNTSIDIDDMDSEKVYTLRPQDFSVRKEVNSNCWYCGEELWKPCVSNIGNAHESVWRRATFWANNAHKNKKTIWVHKHFMQEYGDPLNIVNRAGSRKYAPAEFIKRYLKGFFDIAIFDEAHLYKGGTTGQGHAMHALIMSSKKQLALTGTIAGGYADDMYYLLWRLNPQIMVKKGYSFSDELKFAKKYGKLETVYQYTSSSADGEYNACCKGRQKEEPRVKPGISPLIFTDFLLNSTTFLDLSDMSKYLPKLKEIVCTIDPETTLDHDIVTEYRRVTDVLKQCLHDTALGGKTLLSTMLQFSLSYTDKPYNSGDICSPVTGWNITRPESFDVCKDITSSDNLLAKERKLIALVNQELAEGRNCFVYAEYTKSPNTCVTYRLKEILEKYCHLKGQVAILESNSPKAADREKWMHKQAEKGIRVFITNPRCVETGLDFCFTEGGKEYNYPTIIFYQLGYSLFTIWQASRRSYRLNQRKECRVYYMALNQTIQPDVIEMIAEKQSATSAIQGKFSTEGLAAMANGMDARMKLAQSLSKMDTTSGNDLQNMFDVLHADDADDSYSEFKRMLLFDELTGITETSAVISFDEAKMQELHDLFDMDMFDFANINNADDEADSMIEEEVTLESCTTKRKSRRKQHSIPAGQLSFFNI